MGRSRQASGGRKELGVPLGVAVMGQEPAARRAGGLLGREEVGAFQRAARGLFILLRMKTKAVHSCSFCRGCLFLTLSSDMTLAWVQGQGPWPAQTEPETVGSPERRGGEGMVRLRAGCSFWNLPSERSGDGTNVST